MERLSSAHKQTRELEERLRAAVPHTASSSFGAAGTRAERSWGEGPGQRGARALASSATVTASGSAGVGRRASAGTRGPQRPGTGEGGASSNIRRPPTPSSSFSSESSSSSSSPSTTPNAVGSGQGQQAQASAAVFRALHSGKQGRPTSSAAARTSEAEASRLIALYTPHGYGSRGANPWHVSEAAFAESIPLFASVSGPVEPLGGWGEIGEKLQWATDGSVLERSVMYMPLDKLARLLAALPVLPSCQCFGAPQRVPSLIFLRLPHKRTQVRSLLPECLAGHVVDVLLFSEGSFKTCVSISYVLSFSPSAARG